MRTVGSLRRQNYPGNDSQAGPLCRWRLHNGPDFHDMSRSTRLLGTASNVRSKRDALVLSVAELDALIAKSANQRMTVRPSIAVVNVRKWPGHPQAPADEQKTGAHPHHYNEYQRPHESLPCDEGTTSTRAIFSMRLPQNSSAISGRYLEPEKARKCR